MATIDDVLVWASKLPAWQADAVRRLLGAGDEGLDEAALAEIVALAKSELGLSEAPAELKAVGPAQNAFSGAPVTQAAVKLVSIRNVQNVNIIDSAQTLSFAENGITVVYGANGSGKSGYSRVLKLACRARDKDEHILPNVFATTTAQPTATLQISQDGVTKDVVWTAGVPADPILASIAVFDGRCARVITDAKNDISYLPYGADVFQKLAAVVTKVRAAIESEISDPSVLHDSAIADGTPSKAFLDSLSADTAQAALDAATAWTTRDAETLKSQQDLLAASDAGTTAEEIVRLEGLKRRVQAVAKNAAYLRADFNGLSNDAIRLALEGRRAAERAYKTAHEESAVAEPLPGTVSSEPWRILYDAAKRYSEEVAYPGREFPYLSESLCVLCQQPLSESAVERFSRFKTFIEDETSKVRAAARASIQFLNEAAEKLEALTAEALDAVCADFSSVDAPAAETVRNFHVGVAARRAAILKAVEDDASAEAIDALPGWPASLDEDLNKLVGDLDKKIARISGTAKPAEHAKLVAEVAVLRARRALALRRGDVVAFWTRAKRNAALRSAAATLNTHDITRQSTTIIRKNLTPELLKALRDELTELGATRVPVSLKPVGNIGETSHEMRLEGSVAPITVRPSQILSEGEARVIAIAGFLAELRLTPNSNAVVFDDPVSSLDHVFARKVAVRLAKEGRSRQAIVFTHNIALLMEVRAAAKAMAQSGQLVNVEMRTIGRTGKATGIARASAPWQALTVGGRADELERRTKEIEGAYQDGTDTYNEKAASIYGHLREAWEALVEEQLFNGVVTRFQYEVKTRSLTEVEITDADIHRIDLNMTKASTWMTGHDKSKALHEDRPEPKEILEDIGKLRALAKDIKARQKLTKKRREASLVATSVP